MTTLVLVWTAAILVTLIGGLEWLAGLVPPPMPWIVVTEWSAAIYLTLSWRRRRGL